MTLKRTAALLFALFLPVVILTPSHADDGSLAAEAPKVEAFRTSLNREPSTINIPVEMSTAELAAMLNTTVQKSLYKGSTGTKGVSTDVTRNGSIAVSAADNFLYITLPVGMSLRYSMFESRPIPMKLKFRLAASVTPDWRLVTDVHYQGVSDLLAEEVGIGPLSFKPRSIIDGLMQPVQKVLSDMVTRKVNELLPLKTQVAKVWDSARKPVLLDKGYKAWLKLSPREVMLYPLSARNNRIKLRAYP